VGHTARSLDVSEREALQQLDDQNLVERLYHILEHCMPSVLAHLDLTRLLPSSAAFLLPLVAAWRTVLLVVRRTPAEATPPP
jgi:hypothetical protein